MKTLQTIFFVAYFSLSLLIFGGTIFAVMVEYPNWFADIPVSLQSSREFYRVLHPGYFFQTLAPMLLFSGVAFVATGWKLAPARNLILISLGLMLAAELLTFIYIYPRLNILFGIGVGHQSIEALKQAVSEFTFADQVRTGLSGVATGLAVASVFRFFRARYELH